jgi:hypothetical protein
VAKQGVEAQMSALGISGAEKEKMGSSYIPPISVRERVI